MAILFRQTSCLIEYSEDNGATWSRVGGISECNDLSTPLQPGINTRCNIASYLTMSLNQIVDELLKQIDSENNALNTTGSVLALIAALSFPLSTPVAAVAVVVAGVSSATAYFLGLAGSIDTNNFRNTINQGFYTNARCTLYCHLGNNGTVNSSTIEAWSDAIAAYANYHPFAGYIQQSIKKLSLQTWQSLALVGASLELDSDCNDCDCQPDCTLIPDQSINTPAPVQDQNDSTRWTLTSPSNPNETIDGTSYYKASYRLPYSKSCCQFVTTVSGSFMYPVGKPFAGFRSCGQESEPSFDQEFTSTNSPLIDLYEIGTNIRPCFNSFYIRSTQPFSLSVRIEECLEGGTPNTWCHEFDFAQGTEGWSTVDIGGNFTPSFLGAHSTGAWRDSATETVASNGLITRGVYIRRQFTSTQITRIRVTYDKANGSFIDGNRRLTVAGALNGSVLFDTPGLIGTETTGTDLIHEWNEDAMLDTIILRNDSKYNYSGANGLVIIKKVRIEGTGANPFGTSNCV